MPSREQGAQQGYCITKRDTKAGTKYVARVALPSMTVATERPKRQSAGGHFPTRHNATTWAMSTLREVHWNCGSSR